MDSFTKMDPEDFELAAAAIILLGRIRKRRFKTKPRKQWVRAIIKEREEKSGKTFIIKTLVFFLLQFTILLKLQLLVFTMFMIFFQLMNVIFNTSNYLLQQHYFKHFHFT